MRSHLDAKAMAKTLRSELAGRKFEINYSESLEITARMFGFRDWNTMTACLAAADEVEARSAGDLQPLPDGWHRSGRAHQQYRVGVASLPDTPDARCFAIRSREADVGGKIPDPDDFCTIMQTISAAAYRNGRIKFAAELKCHDVHGSATIWMRVDDAAGRTLAFDNREKAGPDGAITGTTEWRVRAIVLDVPERAESIKFGFYLYGRGRAWARNLDFSMTQESETQNKNLPPEPMNLSL